MNKRLLYTLFSGLVIVAGTVVAIRFAQGYRVNPSGDIQSTGLLSANSFPNAASIYINGNLTSATDTTLNLNPGTYDVEIKKDGYSTWKKTLRVEKELVTQTNALLFPAAPNLSALTFAGATHLTPSPDGQQVLFTTASASARTNGVYVMGLTDSLLALQKGPLQIAKSSANWNLETAEFFWSPDSSEVLLSAGTKNVLLQANRVNDLDAVDDVTVRLSQISAEWKEQFTKKFQTSLDLFPPEIAQIATQSAKDVFISPDQERLLYTATASAVLLEDLIPALPATNTQPEERSVVAGGIYVYDRHEDKNFRIATSLAPSPSPTLTPTPVARRLAPTINPVTSPSATASANLLETPLQTLTRLQKQTSGVFMQAPQWLPNSKHIILTTLTGIDIVEYDGTNRTTVYAGPFAQNFVYPWPNGSKLIILTNFNQSETALYNLYAVGLR